MRRDQLNLVRARAYGATSFSAAVLMGIFNLYYVEVYNSIYGLDPKWFHSCQIVFAVWNAFNDPLFGYLNDRAPGLRARALHVGGMGWCLAFLLPWFPLIFTPAGPAASILPTAAAAAQASPGESFQDEQSILPWNGIIGFHFLVSICLFDTFLTYVMIAHSALLADLTASEEERDQLNKWRQIGSVLGALPVFGAYMLFDPDDMAGFKVYCVCVAILASFGFRHTAQVIASQFPTSNNTNNSTLNKPRSLNDLQQQSNLTSGTSADVERSSLLGNSNSDGVRMLQSIESPLGSIGLEKGRLMNSSVRNPNAACGGSVCGRDAANIHPWLTGVHVMLSFMKQAMHSRNFRLFVSMNFVQYFNTHFNSNFYTVFERTVFDGMGQTGGSGIGIFRSIVTFAVLILPPLCVLGLTGMGRKHSIIQGINVAKFALSMLVMLFGTDSPSIMGLYLVLSSVLNGAAFGFYDLVVADLIDEDAVVNHRPRPLGAMMHGTQSLIVKPAQSLAPIFGVSLFSADATGKLDTNSILFIITLVPAVCSAIQIAVWSMYKLRGPYLAAIKQRRVISGLGSDFAPY